MRAVSSSELLHISFLTASAMLDGTTCSKSGKSRRLQTKNKRIGRHITVRWLQAHANANEDKIKVADKLYTFFHTIIRYIIVDLIRIQQGVDSAARCSATAILYHCDGHFISLRKIQFKLFADLNFRGWLPIRENRESLGPRKLERVRYIVVSYPAFTHLAYTYLFTLLYPSSPMQ